MKEDLIYTDLKSECALLGSVILQPVKYYDIQQIVPESLYFSIPENQIIFDVLGDVYNSGQLNMDLVLLRDKLKAAGNLDAVGGIEYVTKLVETLPSSENAEYYAGIVRDKYKRRRIRDYGQSVSTQTLDCKVGVDEIHKNACNDIQCVFDDTVEDGYTLLSEAFEAFDIRQSTNYVSTGLEYHDDVYYGFGEGHVIIIAGRPGMGKTSLMMEMAVRQCQRDIPVAFFSLEMPKRDITQRILCSSAKVNLYNALMGAYTSDEESRIATVKATMKSKNLIIDETRNLSPVLLRTRLFMLKHRFDIKVVYIDYLQLMRSNGKSRGKYEDVSAISREIKSIALQLEIPIIVGCQLNRENEKREDKRPRLSDLRDSGDIEQDADVVMLCHRPAYYDPELDRNDAEIIVAKNRRGRTQTIPMNFRQEYCCFEEKLGGVLGPVG